jgi:hypothetical protein
MLFPSQEVIILFPWINRFQIPQHGTKKLVQKKEFWWKIEHTSYTLTILETLIIQLEKCCCLAYITMDL